MAIELAACAGDQCTAVRRVAPDESQIASIRPGSYELRVVAGKKTLWRMAAELRTGTQEIRVEPPLRTLSGRVTRGADGVPARVSLGRDTIGSYDIDLPRPLNVRVIATETGKTIKDARVIVRVPDTADPAMLRLNASLPPTDDRGMTAAAATPMQPFYVCASAADYQEDCSRPMERAPAEPIELALRAVSAQRGRIVTAGILSSAFLVRLAADGTIIESVPVGPDGEFRLKAPVTTVEHAILVSASHPLFVTRLAPEGSLTIDMPGAASRTAVVTLRSGGDAEIGVSVLGVMIPQSVFARHQAFRGRSAFATNGRLDITDLPAGAPIVVYRGFGRGERPPSLPAHGDPFLLPAYRAAFAQVPLAADGTAAFE